MALKKLIKSRIEELEKEIEKLLAKGDIHPANKRLKSLRQAKDHNKRLLFVIEQREKGYRSEAAESLYKTSKHLQ
jgi:hypothetical protein